MLLIFSKMDVNSYKELWSECKKYIALQMDYAKLTIVEKITIILSAMTFVGVIIVLSICALFFLSVAFVEWLDMVIKCTWLANIITGAIILVLMLIVICLKKSLIINPMSKFITKLFLNPPKK